MIVEQLIGLRGIRKQTRYTQNTHGKHTGEHTRSNSFLPGRYYLAGEALESSAQFRKATRRPAPLVDGNQISKAW